MTGTMTTTKATTRTTTVDTTRTTTRINRARVSGLSVGEHDVLELMAAGLTNRSIAGRLWISQKTVEARIGAIFRKLGLHDDVMENRRVVAVLVYLRHIETLAHEPEPIAS